MPEEKIAEREKRDLNKNTSHSTAAGEFVHEDKGQEGDTKRSAVASNARTAALKKEPHAATSAGAPLSHARRAARSD